MNHYKMNEANLKHVQVAIDGFAIMQEVATATL
jgi:hypothetical protein